MRNAHARFKALEPLRRQQLFNQPLQKEGSPSKQRLGGRVPLEQGDDTLLSRLRHTQDKVGLGINKIDRLRNKSLLLPLLDSYAKAFPFEFSVPLSAKTGEGCSTLLKQ